MLSKTRYAEARKRYAALMDHYPFNLEDLCGENWRVIKNHNALYQVSNFGRVKSFQCKKPKILKPKLSSQGYLYFTLSQNGVTRNWFAHRLIAAAFLENSENKLEVNHKDGCKLNNHVSNLEWVTRSENTQHAARTGLVRSGENHARAKLTNAQAIWCRDVYQFRNPEFGANALAEKIGVTPSTISCVVHGKTFKKIGASR